MSRLSKEDRREKYSKRRAVGKTTEKSDRQLQTAQFLARFEQHSRSLLREIGATRKQQCQQEVRATLRELRASLARLENMAAAASHFLPAWEQRDAKLRLKSIRETLLVTTQHLVPKQRFTFSSRRQFLRTSARALATSTGVGGGGSHASQAAEFKESSPTGRAQARRRRQGVFVHANGAVDVEGIRNAVLVLYSSSEESAQQQQQHQHAQTPSPRHPSQTPSPRHPSQTPSPRNPSQTPSPRHPSQTPSPRHPSQTPSPRHPSQYQHHMLGKVGQLGGGEDSGCLCQPPSHFPVHYHRVPTFADVQVAGCQGVFVYVLSPLGALRVVDVSDTCLVAACVAGSCYVEQLERCTLALATRQLRMHHARDVHCFLHIKSRPIIEDCDRIGFADGAGMVAYRGSRTHMKNAGFSVPPLTPQHTTGGDPHDMARKIDQSDRVENHWAEVDDFKWLRAQHSPHWFLIPVGERAFRVFNDVPCLGGACCREGDLRSRRFWVPAPGLPRAPSHPQERTVGPATSQASRSGRKGVGQPGEDASTGLWGGRVLAWCGVGVVAGLAAAWYLVRRRKAQ